IFYFFQHLQSKTHPTTPHKKKNPPTTKSPQKKSECSELLRVLRVLPKSPTKKILHHKKGKKKIATRQAGSNHHIKQLLSLNQKI
ncbi:MAG: hypothetical protein SO408_04350, partial [Sodaliphilus sp.]|nr:hypothetical protein [Sodaliphilus sp.]